MHDALPLSLYVHMPWCVRKCPYCDFNSHALNAAVDRRGYREALRRDFERDIELLGARPIESVFFGGGTPSLFAPEDFAWLLDALRAAHPILADAEITLEANPGTIERGRFQGYREAGITRVSLGAQSFSAKALARLGRIHALEDTLRSVDELRAAGVENFNLDLMYALPEQTLEEALADVRMACELEPAHLSHYQLTLEPGTVFHARPPPLPDEDLAWRMQIEAQALIAANGFEQYEVSAYARPGRRCHHNLNYWRFGDYVGIGAGAHGKLSAHLPDGVLRTVKARMPGEFMREVAASVLPAGARTPVERASLPFEFMLNALRLQEGFSSADFEARTGLPFATVRPTLEQAAKRRLVEVGQTGGREGSHSRWRPSELGRRFLNDLQAQFLG
jgi:oxygen-independent coproporphyrinogen-3 oxidase